MSKQLLQLALDVLNEAADWIDPDEAVQQRISELIESLKAELHETTKQLDNLPRYRGVSQEEYDAMTPRQKQFMDTWT
jgi:hypothetical protein